MAAKHVEHGISGLVKSWSIGREFAGQALTVEFKLAKTATRSFKSVTQIDNDQTYQSDQENMWQTIPDKWFAISSGNHKKNLNGPDQRPEDDENQKAELGEQTDPESKTGETSRPIRRISAVFNEHVCSRGSDGSAGDIGGDESAMGEKIWANAPESQAEKSA